MPFNAEPPASVLATVRPAAVISGDEQVVSPVGPAIPDPAPPLSLACVIGAHGAERVLEPAMIAEERSAHQNSATVLRAATAIWKEAVGTLVTAQVS